MPSPFLTRRAALSQIEKKIVERVKAKSQRSKPVAEIDKEDGWKKLLADDETNLIGGPKE